MKRLIPLFATLLVFLLSFTTVAHAAAAVEPVDGSLLDLLKPIYAAFLGGQYVYAGSISLVFAVALARRYGTDKIPFLATDLGSAVLVLLGSFGGALTTTLAAGAVPSWAMVWTALTIAFGAAGGYTVVKHLIIEPYVLKLADKGPAWLHAPMALVLWVFQETAGNTPEGKDVSKE